MVIFNSYVINYQRVAGIYLKLWITSGIKSYGFFSTEYVCYGLWVMNNPQKYSSHINNP